jgi:hypothetical protein
MPAHHPLRELATEKAARARRNLSASSPSRFCSLSAVLEYANTKEWPTGKRLPTTTMLTGASPPDDAYGLRPPGSHRVAFFVGAFDRSARVSLGAIMVEHEKADCRGEVAMLAIGVDG